MKSGVILLNIGTPRSFATKDVAKYLNEFLMDPDVVSLPLVLRYPLVRGLIVPRRAPLSAAKYKKIWTDKGSPLMYISQQIADQLQVTLDMPVRLGMRYGQNSILQAVQEMQQMKVDQLLIVPMFPQYAGATTGSVIKELDRALLSLKYAPRVRTLRSFFDEDFFVEPQMRLMADKIPAGFDHILFSFHGLPESHVQRDVKCSLGSCCETGYTRNCYRAQSLRTAQVMADRLHLAPRMWGVSFQSRLGPVEWLKPYTDQRIISLAQSGVKSLMVVCPSFVVDCLETLEEIGLEMRELFKTHGGERFELIPAVNAESDWVQGLAKALVKLQGPNADKRIILKSP